MERALKKPFAPNQRLIRSRALSLVLSLVSIAGFLGCAGVSIYSAGPMIEAPEIPPKLELGFGAEPAVSYEYTGDASARPPTLNNPEVRSGTMLISNLGYAVTDWIELGGRLLPGGSGAFPLGGLALTGKIQVLGNKSTPGLCAAVYGGTFFSATSSRGDQKGLFGPGGHNWEAQAKSDTLTAGASIGYRQSPATLFFLAVSYANQMLSGSIHHDASSDLSSPAADYKLDDLNGNARALALGARFGEKFMLQVDGRLLDRSWPGYAAPSRGGGAHQEYQFGVGFVFN